MLIIYKRCAQLWNNELPQSSTMFASQVIQNTTDMMPKRCSPKLKRRMNTQMHLTHSKLLTIVTSWWNKNSDLAMPIFARSPMREAPWQGAAFQIRLASWQAERLTGKPPNRPPTRSWLLLVGGGAQSNNRLANIKMQFHRLSFRQ